MDNWKKVFREFYNDNEAGGSSRWLVAPNTVEIFIEGLLRENTGGHIYCEKDNEEVSS